MLHRRLSIGLIVVGAALAVQGCAVGVDGVDMDPADAAPDVEESIASSGEPEEAIDGPIAQVEQKWWIDRVPGTSDTSGHEILLGAAILGANAVGAAYPMLGLLETCNDFLANPLLTGNCDTDTGGAPLEALYDTGPQTFDQWQLNPKLQNLHFLRNYVGAAGAVGSYRACVQGRDRIIAATRRAVEAWRSGLHDLAYYYAGHATHTLQDAFSPVHTTRTNADISITDVCVWQRNVAGACKHDNLNALTGDSFVLHPELSNLAIDATRTYLSRVWELFEDDTACVTNGESCETKVRDKLRTMFSDDLVNYMSCQNLPAASHPQVTWRDAGSRSSVASLAGCENGYLYALHLNGNLYRNTADGANGSWVYREHLDDAMSITCVGNTLHQFDVNDRLRKKVGDSWVNVETLGTTTSITSNYSKLYAARTNNRIYVKNGSTWFRVGTYPTNAKLAGGVERDPTTNSRIPRLFMLDQGSLKMSMANGRDGYWTTVGSRPEADRITGGAPGKVWVMQPNNHLYEGTISY